MAFPLDNIPMKSQPGPVIRDEALKLALASRGAAVVTIVPGDTSMEPTLSGGDAILAVPLSGGPARGDLLVFRQNADLVVHRYIGPARTPAGDPCWRTRGDGRAELDPPLLPEAVRGRAAAVRVAGTWRSIDGPASRVYARLVAWHDLAWAGAIHVVRPIGLAAAVTAVDRGLLRLATRAWSHPQIAAPEGAVHDVSV